VMAQLIRAMFTPHSTNFGKKCSYSFGGLFLAPITDRGF